MLFQNHEQDIILLLHQLTRSKTVYVRNQMHCTIVHVEAVKVHLPSRSRPT